MSKKDIFGTKEWAKYNENCITGCKHNCRYCYARYNSEERFQLTPKGTWTEEKVKGKSISKGFGKRSGTIMFPTSHDIHPDNVDICLDYLRKMLDPGNRVLIVTKPHLSCIELLCKHLAPYKNQILFRFTITCCDDKLQQYWEPGAPSIQERRRALRHARGAMFQTSISIEPCLDWKNLGELIFLLEPYVTHSIWIGTLNFIDQRVRIETEEDQRRVDELKKWQTQETFEAVYEAFKDHPLIRWKESMKKALGLELAQEAGLDI